MGAKETAVQSAKDSMAAAQDQALSTLFDAGAATGTGGDDGINQGTVDAAVAAQSAKDAQAMADAQAAHDAQIAALQSDLDKAKADGKMSADQVQALQNNIDNIQATFDAFKAAVNAVLNPPPPPAPTPVPVS